MLPSPHHRDVIYLGMKEGSRASCYSKLSLHQFGQHTFAFYTKCVLPVGQEAVVVDVEASAPKAYPRVALASARTLSGSVVRTLGSGEGL